MSGTIPLDIHQPASVALVQIIYPDSSILHKRSSLCFFLESAEYNSKHSVPLPVSNPETMNSSDRTHSDLLVPLSGEYQEHRKYMVTFVEDNTRDSEVNFLHKNSDAPRLIEALCDQVDTEMQRYPRSFHTDQGGVFVNGDLEAFLKAEVS